MKIEDLFLSSFLVEINYIKIVMLNTKNVCVKLFISIAIYRFFFLMPVNTKCRYYNKEV